ncbi:hypothetical protein ABH37_19735 [Mycobacterium haemophilum]|uniref:Uncharacterized protein n=1 Tax=Mycobacterium haemophilum TaxID=29311 RepID=A0A0I9UQ48_9MYCO|nr:hypothetical protein ABH39_16360 [Mycobacterium haemophilum]KLO36090.1 hypothetical protein ABH37_19735 [Mycobacterium haemophilum]KLO38346.1 hypothetical protein ABH38_02585 [Mycobacterium haemophilum]KLO44243.1 hypothetical protein ABH36_19595 [Mycobacterium haemophilum]
MRYSLISSLLWLCTSLDSTCDECDQPGLRQGSQHVDAERPDEVGHERFPFARVGAVGGAADDGAREAFERILQAEVTDRGLVVNAPANVTNHLVDVGAQLKWDRRVAFQNGADAVEVFGDFSESTVFDGWNDVFQTLGKHFQGGSHQWVHPPWAVHPLLTC